MKSLKVGLKTTGVMLLLLLGVLLPLYSSSSVEIEREDWILINKTFNQQKVQLEDLNSQLTELQIELKNSETQLSEAKTELTQLKEQQKTSLEQLEISKQSLTSITKEMRGLRLSNTLLRVGLGVTITVGVGGLIYVMIRGLK